MNKEIKLTTIFEYNQFCTIYAEYYGVGLGDWMNIKMKVYGEKKGKRKE